MQALRMPFGRHKGKFLDEIPASYLRWVLRECDNITPGLRRAIEAAIDYEEFTPEPPRPGDLAGVVRDWYRDLALTYHPDKGGSVAAMQVVNECHERLKRRVGA
jgi:hypothetical protein